MKKKDQDKTDAAPVKTEPEKKDPPMFVFESKVFRKEENPLFSGDAIDHTLQLASRTPHINWKGDKLPWKIFCQIYTFFVWVYNEHKREAQCRVLYNYSAPAETGPEDKYRVVVFPQTGAGAATTEDIGDGPEKQELRNLLAHGWMQTQTWHSHPSFAAFQSGTDKHDEYDQPGMHVTLGKLTEKQIDIHHRLVYNGFSYPDSDIKQWVAIPVTTTNLPLELEMLIAGWYYTHPRKEEFPEAWKKAIRDNKIVNRYPSETKVGGKTVYGYGGNQNQGYWPKGRSGRDDLRTDYGSMYRGYNEQYEGFDSKKEWEDSLERDAKEFNAQHSDTPDATDPKLSIAKTEIMENAHEIMRVIRESLGETFIDQALSDFEEEDAQKEEQEELAIEQEYERQMQLKVPTESGSTNEADAD